MQHVSIKFHEEIKNAKSKIDCIEPAGKTRPRNKDLLSKRHPDKQTTHRHTHSHTQTETQTNQHTDSHTKKETQTDTPPHPQGPTITQSDRDTHMHMH